MSILKNTDVIIIGAGIAGLAAAKTLLENGIEDFVMIEAQDYIGGRIKTETFPDGVIEYGAQWLHGVDNPLKTFADTHNLLSLVRSSEGRGKYIRVDGYVYDDITVAKVDFVVGEILSRCEDLKSSADNDLSVGEYLMNEFNNYLNILDEETSVLWKQLLHWHIKFQLIDNSCESLNNLSAKHWGDYDFNGDDSQSHINFSNGYSSIITKIMEIIPTEKVYLQKPVSKILWKRGDNQVNVEIQCSDDSNFVANHVICTMPLGVLKAEHDTIFTPALPSGIVTAIKSLGFGNVGKIFLQFEYAWWDQIEGFQVIWDLNETKDSWLTDISGFDVLNVGLSNTLIGWVGSNGTKVMEGLTDEEIANDCLGLLRSIAGMEVPPIKNIRRSTWFSNPYVRGGYSHTTLQCNVYSVTPSCLLAPVVRNGKPVVLFAGEACHDAHFSTTHGAFETGEIQAKRLINYLKHKTYS